MRVLIFLALSGILLAQPTSKQDSIPAKTEQIPETVKPTVEKIVENSKQAKKAETELTKEMLKQIDLMKQIKLKILELKKAAKTKAKPFQKDTPKDINQSVAIKQDSVSIEVAGQIVQWETRKRTWLGRLLHAEDILYYPFIIDKDGNKMYLK